jgi:excisionase family DNA binding protein
MPGNLTRCAQFPGESCRAKSDATDARLVALDVASLPTPRLLLRPEEAAGVLGLSRTKVFELIGSGELRSIKIAHLRRVSASALAEYVERLDRP